MLIVAIVCITIGALSAYVFMRAQRGDPLIGSSDESETSSLIRPDAIGALASVDRSKADTAHLANGIVPPTNTWFSGLALQATAQPIFSYPNSVRVTANGFELGLPDVVTTPTSITGAHQPGVVVSIASAERYEITRYDELTVDVTYLSSDGSRLATATLAAGSPYVFIRAQKTVDVSYSDPTRVDDTTSRIKGSNAWYGVRVDDSSSLKSGSVTLSKDSRMSVYSAPNEQTLTTVAEYAMNDIRSARATYEGSDTVRTTLTYETSNGKPTLLSRLPHQQSPNDDVTGVKYRSILGTLTTRPGTKIEYDVPAIEIKPSLDLASISPSEKSFLMDQLKKDTAAPPTEADDTYFGGKQLQRTAQLLALADQLGAEQQKQTLIKDLQVRLERWFDGESFEYDSKAHTIVGKNASFGADTEINDHHFHYGYMIYASGVLAKFDPNFKRTYQPAVDLLVADIANYKTGEQLPQRRNFDPYFGHSWASGTAPFRDGNNQESTSEAINAWTATGMWAEQTDNQALLEQSKWMLANEVATAQRYWLLKPAVTDEYLKGYTAPNASIVWGGKREYATFFSDAANAKLAILLLPLNPSMRAYTEPLDTGSYEATNTDQPLGDYILMSRDTATLDQAKRLDDASIDDGNSRTYMYAYIVANRK